MIDYYAYIVKKAQNVQNKKKTTLSDEISKINYHLAFFISDKKLRSDIRYKWLKSLKITNCPWPKDDNKHFDFCMIPNNFRFTPDISDIDWLPSFSFMLKIPFKLKKPYISKDDRDYYILDNPLRRDKVFKTPMVAASGWKGALRSAMVQELVNWWEQLEPSEKEKHTNRKLFVAWRYRLAKIFGQERNFNEEDNENYLDKIGGEYQACCYRRYIKACIERSGHFSGCLYFYPTFFQKVSKEVITPLDRKTGKPIKNRGPIFLESVPLGACGELILLYTPFSQARFDETKHREIIAWDLKLLAYGIKAMLTKYGFGAKTSSGFGLADEKLPYEGKLVVKAALPFKKVSSFTFNTLKELCDRIQEVSGLLRGGNCCE